MKKNTKIEVFVIFFLFCECLLLDNSSFCEKYFINFYTKVSLTIVSFFSVLSTKHIDKETDKNIDYDMSI